jgi:hypothetical protein
MLVGACAIGLVVATATAAPAAAQPHQEPQPATTTEQDVPLGNIPQPLKQPLQQPATIHLTRTNLKQFQLVGVTWRYDKAIDDVNVSVRTKVGPAEWSQWQTEGVMDSADNATRGGTEPIWTGPATAIDIAVTTNAKPQDLSLALIDPKDTPELKIESIRGRAPMPRIYGRASWGADPRMMTWKPSYSPIVKAIAFHHTVNTNTYTAAQVPAIIRGIYRYHAITNKWGDIGYNALVDRFGRIWEGRAGGITRAVIGAHSGGFNYDTAGIAMIGNFDKANLPQPMKNAAAAFIGWKLSLYHVNPNGMTNLVGGPSTRFRSRVTVRVPTVFPHRQTSNTDCPGDAGMRALPGIRYQALHRIR